MGKLLLDTRAVRPRTRMVRPLQSAFDHLFAQEQELVLRSAVDKDEIGDIRRARADEVLSTVEEAYTRRLEGMHLLQWCLVAALGKSAKVIDENMAASAQLRKKWRDRLIKEFVSTLEASLRRLIPERPGRPIGRTQNEKAALKAELEDAFPEIRADLVRRRLPHTRKDVFVRMSKRKWGDKKEFLSPGTIDHLLNPRRR